MSTPATGFGRSAVINTQRNVTGYLSRASEHSVIPEISTSEQGSIKFYSKTLLVPEVHSAFSGCVTSLNLMVCIVTEKIISDYQVSSGSQKTIRSLLDSLGTVLHPCHISDSAAKGSFKSHTFTFAECLFGP